MQEFLPEVTMGTLDNYSTVLSAQLTRKSLCAFLSLVLILLLTCNGATIFSVRVPFPAKTSPEPASFSPENVTGKSRTLVSVSSSRKLSSSLMLAVKEEVPVSKPDTHFHISRKNRNLVAFRNASMAARHRRRRKNKSLIRIMGSEAQMSNFSRRVKDFFHGNSCKLRFFMTWISSVESFSNREMMAIESLFKAHPHGCLILASSSVDSTEGTKILSPFLKMGLKITAISPDFNYLFKNTAAYAWFGRLKRGNIDPGEVSIGQNLSNLLRLGLLYKFGGIYLDTDVIVLKSFEPLRNAIGAQTMNLETRNWSRLNNAVMVFDKGHPLVSKFIQEFALTFDGNKWGHNGPYLVSRVVARVKGREGHNITVLPPKAFYPVDWSRIGSLFQGPRNVTHLKWLLAKLSQIRCESFAVHLWNKQSRGLEIEEGSVIQHIVADSCVFCNSSSASSQKL
nr:lactosylceramide 4-alpha-galactosyltransferase [Ipomoea batatas]